MSRTFALLAGTFPLDLAKLIYSFFTPQLKRERDEPKLKLNTTICERRLYDEDLRASHIRRKIEAGDYEACCTMPISYDHITDAAKSGYEHIWRLMSVRAYHYAYEHSLYEAARMGHRPIIDAIIDGMPTLEAGLRGACAGGQLDIAHIMIARGAHNWAAAMTEACRYGHANMIPMLVAHGAPLAGMIHEAADGDHLDIIPILIDHGADPADAIDPAANMLNEPLIARLLALPAPPDLTPIWNAVCKAGMMKWVEQMIPWAGPEWIESGLQHACHSGQSKLAKDLLTRGPTNLRSAFVHACFSDDMDTINLFSSLPVWDVATGLQIGSKYFRMVTIELMLAYGATNYDNAVGEACARFADLNSGWPASETLKAWRSHPMFINTITRLITAGATACDECNATASAHLAIPRPKMLPNRTNDYI